MALDIRGNVFVLKDEGQPAVHLATPDCVGVELIDNVLYGGSGQIVEAVHPQFSLLHGRVAPCLDVW